MPKRPNPPDAVRPLVRPLKVYAFDPSLGSRYGNEMTLSVAYEPLRPGPEGSRLKVIDYDSSSGCYYPPADLEHPSITLQGGLSPSEADPRFHQQMVYAVATKTIENFSHALGRQVHWSKPRGQKERRRLRIFPHAMQDANAFYDPDRHALLFGYFEASRRDAGSNLPGQIVHTCLSHDIVAHETGHALLHDLRPCYLEPTGPDTLAFHEAFADIVALFQHFSFREALVDHLMDTAGLLYRPNLAPTVSAAAGETPSLVAERSRPNVLIGLAQQFGEALEMRAALRSALGTPHDPSALPRRTEPHERGAILVACVFDAFFSAYLRRMRDLLRIGGIGSALTSSGMSLELARRLSTEASKTAGQFLTMCVRALDYCPPVDVTFGDFLRAVITVDMDLVQDDPLGYRDLLVEAFRARGVHPGEVASYSDDALRWRQPHEEGQPLKCEGLHFDVIGGTGRQEQSNNARRLSRFGTAHADALHLDPDLPVQAQSFHPVYRVGEDGQLAFQVVAQLLQRREVPVPGRPKTKADVYRGGTTLIIDLPEGVVRYAVYKRVSSKDRLERQAEFRAEWRAGLAGPFVESGDLPPRADFARLHRGY